MASRNELYDGYDDFDFSDVITYEHLRATIHGRTLKAYCSNFKKDYNYGRFYYCVDEDIEDEQIEYDTALLEYLEYEEDLLSVWADDGSYEYSESEYSACYIDDWRDTDSDDSIYDERD